MLYFAPKGASGVESGTKAMSWVKGRIPAFLLVMSLIPLLGCATAYVATLRSEYATNGRIHGVHKGDSEYPTLYPATQIAATVEVPSWWLPSDIEIGTEYKLYLWPIGAVGSLVDVPISIVTDTIMLPYDAYQIPSKEAN